jgi:Rps23 Pro-64 3,4-dihydroxylase Tpa1-like proline 4-hydroxylase
MNNSSENEVANSIVRYKNVLSEETYKTVKDLILGPFLPYYYTYRTIVEESFGDMEKSQSMLIAPITDKTKDAMQFQHKFVHNYEPNSHSYDVCALFLQEAVRKCGLPPYRVVRVQANLMIADALFPIGFYNRPHIDNADLDDGGAKARYKTLLYYVNDSDGDTFIFNELFNGEPPALTVAKTVTPVANTAVFFDSHRYHTSSSPRKTEVRAIINTVFDTQPQLENK